MFTERTVEIPHLSGRAGEIIHRAQVCGYQVHDPNNLHGRFETVVSERPFRTGGLILPEFPQPAVRRTPGRAGSAGMKPLLRHQRFAGG